MSNASMVVVGGGPAGMMAALRAAQRGWHVMLLERNEKLGKKLYITGKGRCNLTNTAEKEPFFRHILRNPRFLLSAWPRMNNVKLMDFMEGLGVPLKEERGGRVFPISEKASDITRTLERELHVRGVEIRLNCRVAAIVTQDGAVTGVQDTQGQVYAAQHVVIATGGFSYPATGSTGDGMDMARALGLDVTPCTPSLVSLTSPEPWVVQLAGLTLKNVVVRAHGFKLKSGKKPWRSEVGEMLFTHSGVSGPLVLSLSALVEQYPFTLSIDLKPGMDEQELDARLLRDLEENSRKQALNALSGLLPASLLPVVLQQAGIDDSQPANQVDRAARHRLMEALKGLTLSITGSGGYEEAVVTRGGVDVRQLDPRDMSVKLEGAPRGLAFAGEVLDVDATTGGFNLTIAFMTGYCAGDIDPREVKE